MGLEYSKASERIFVLFFSCQEYCTPSKSICLKSKHKLEAVWKEGYSTGFIFSLFAQISVEKIS
jgi:hypothetical protein